MAKINDTTTYPNTTPALDDHVIGTDVSDTGNSADGEVVTFLLGDIVKLGGFKGLQVFTSSGTWSRPTGVNSVLIFATGGGGGGGNNSYGGAGGTAIKRLSVTGIASSTITIGAVGGFEGNGGSSSWADGTNTVTGSGGGGTGVGGPASGGDINLTGIVGDNTAHISGSFWGPSYGKGGTNGGTGGTAGIVVVFEFG